MGGTEPGTYTVILIAGLPILLALLGLAQRAVGATFDAWDRSSHRSRF